MNQAERNEIRRLQAMIRRTKRQMSNPTFRKVTTVEIQAAMAKRLNENEAKLLTLLHRLFMEANPNTPAYKQRRSALVRFMFGV